MRAAPLALVALLSACMAPPEGDDGVTRHVARAVAAPPGAGTIEKVTYTGTGCPEKSATNAFSPDKQVVTTIFSAFVAEKGGSANPEGATKSCLVMMDVNVPPGWSYSIESLDYRGFVGLEGEVTATRRGLYFISGDPVQVASAGKMRGSKFEEFIHSDVGPTKPGVWSPCGGGQVLGLAVGIEVNNSARPTRQGTIHLDTIDTEIQWRRCQ